MAEPRTVAATVELEHRAGITIAKLIPTGREAEGTFSHVVDSKHLTAYHKRYIKQRPYEKPPTRHPIPSESVESWISIPTGYDTYEKVRLSPEPNPPRPRRDPTSEKSWTGYYELATDRPGQLKGSMGWTVGRGSTKWENLGVDLLVVAPDDYPYDVDVVHALIQLHPQSGVLMLKGVSETAPVKYYLDETVDLYFKDRHVLFQKENRFSLGKLDFTLVYEELDEKKYSDYLCGRNRSLEDDGKSVPDHRILPIPKNAHVKVGNFLHHENISSGGFGLVFAAVEARTGAPFAMKETWIKRPEMLRDKGFQAERDISREFKGAEGLVQAHTIKCQHGQDEPCGKIPERFYMTFPLALHDFSQHNWSNASLATILTFIKQPLKGLEALHAAGYMHRDISFRNILVMSIQPPRAAICDYGKARRAKYHYDYCLGPIPTLAPEVTGNTSYSNKIDIWGIGLICCEILFPSVQSEFRERTANKRQPDNIWHQKAMAYLSKYGNNGTRESSFVDMVRRMLDWNPAHRPSAAEALQHSCMRAVPTYPEPSGSKTRVAESKSSAAIKKRACDSHSGSGDTEPLTPGRQPPSFGESAQDFQAAAVFAKARAIEQAKRSKET
jgi:serine/threonine protein kinase